jgi:hypothetical protein
MTSLVFALSSPCAAKPSNNFQGDGSSTAGLQQQAPLVAGLYNPYRLDQAQRRAMSEVDFCVPQTSNRVACLSRLTC